MDYDGKGEHQNNVVKTYETYSILTSTDAVWMRRHSYLFESTYKSSRSAEIQIMKYAAFCLMNNASDVAISILLEARKKHGMKFNIFQNMRL